LYPIKNKSDLILKNIKLALTKKKLVLKKINNCLIPPNNDFFEKELNSYKIWLNKIFDK